MSQVYFLVISEKFLNFLVLVAYTVSLYHAAHGSYKDQLTVSFSISFAMVLYDKPLDVQGSDGRGDEDGDPHGGKASDNQNDEKLQDQSGEEAKEVEELSDAVVKVQKSDQTGDWTQDLLDIYQML